MATRKAGKRSAPEKSTGRGAPGGESGPAVEITRELLHAMPLPHPDPEDDKEARGRVLILGGGAQTPGALLLAGTAALRAGAGKLQVTATEPATAGALGVALPEARVVPVAHASFEDEGAARLLDECLAKADAVCVGPGWVEPDEHGFAFTRLARVGERATLVIDAKAVGGFLGARLPADLRGRTVLTPNAEELSEVMNPGPEGGADEPVEVARHTARESGTIVVMKGRETFIAAPDGRAFVNRAGNVGLATSGSGDVLAGLVAGLAARGASPLAAAVWGVHAHAVAGDLLAQRVAPLGFMARELSDVLPRVLWELAAGEGAAAGRES